MWIDNKKRKREYEVKCDGCTFAKEMCRCWWWWYTRGVENNAATFDRFYWFFGSKNFMVISFGWTMYAACECVHYSSISLHAIELNRVCKFQRMQLQQQWISFYCRFFQHFFSYFSLWYMSLVSVTAWMKKKIDHKFSFCTIFFPRFIQKKSTIFSISLFDDWKNPPRCARKKADPVCQHSQKEWKPIKMRKLNK